MSKNFIRQNIHQIKGSRQPPSIIQDEFKSRFSASKTKKKYENVVSHYKQPTIGNRVTQMQKKLQDMQKDRSQSLIINHIADIKDDIRLIKSHLFQLKKSSGVWQQEKLKTQSSGGQEQNIYLTVGNNNRMRSQGSQQQMKQNNSKVSQNQSKGSFVKSEHQVQNQPTLQQLLNQHEKRHSMNNKQGVSIKSIFSMLKQYKLQGPQTGTIFYGYSKRNLQPVSIKYVPNVQQANNIIQVYDKLWKNIAKAKWPCINKIYDYKIEQNNFIILEKNKSTIANLPFKLVILDIFKSLEFIHQCGYLYRNVEPEHFMLNQEGQLTVIDFQRAKRYINVKGHSLEVFDTTYNSSTFASNNQVRGMNEGRKDDLESLGYFALLLMGLNIPWYGLNKESTIKIRSTITLQELFKGHQGWIEYMATVIRLAKNQRPDYRKLQDILERL